MKRKRARWWFRNIALGMLLSLAAPARAQPPRPFSATVAVDAGNRVIGPFFPNPGQVLLEVDGAFVLVPIAQQGFVATGVTPFYTTPNCTGAVFGVVDGDFNQLAEPEFDVGLVDNVLYFINTANTQTICAQSFQRTESTGVVEQCQTLIPCVPEEAGPLLMFDLNSLQFEAPFSLRR